MALYPPIVASSMPAFNYQDTSVRIYFTISGYNSLSIDQIKRVQISVRYQNSNLSALLDLHEYITKTEIEFDEYLNKYYILLNKSDLSTGEFEKDRLYKVQLRISTASGSVEDSYTNDILNFSLWSTVCIIKSIQAPIVYILDFNKGKEKGLDSDVTDLNNFFSTFADFVAIYDAKESSEVLKQWRLRIVDNSFTKEDLNNIDDYVLKSQNGTLADSGYITVSANNYNLNSNNLVLECSIPYELKQTSPGPNYKLYLLIVTKNDYTRGVLYNFTYTPLEIDAITGGELTTSVNEEEGYIKLHFKSDVEILATNIVIRRTDSKSNFTKWEDLKNFQVESTINFDYYDFTVLSGILYRYLVQKRDSRGRRGAPTYDYPPSEDKGTMVEWEHAFLLESTGNGVLNNTVEQLKLKYDFQISSYKTNISESRTDTIGSKYPYIRRNGNMYYRSFPITGTITAYMDEAELFVTKNDMYNGLERMYKLYRGLYTRDGLAKGLITWFTNVYDYTKERLFREKVEAFLYNAKPKLYKSMQLGNIFIKLMEVSLTPKNELGRLIYTFSATAYLIDLACIDTYDRYNLINIGHYNTNVYTLKTIMGQLNGHDANLESGVKKFPGGQDILGAKKSSDFFSSPINIANHVRYDQSFNQFIVTDFKLNWLRLIIESLPYLIMLENGSYRVLDDRYDNTTDYWNKELTDNISNPINYPLYQIESTYADKNIYLGWLFTINGLQIIVAHPNNIYLINEKEFVLNTNSSIIPAKDIEMSIDYRADLKVVEDIDLIPKSITVDNINSQLVGPFNSGSNLVNNIRYKYKYTFAPLEDNSYEKVKKYLNGVQTILVDTLPNTVIYLKTSVDNAESRFVVNETGELKFDPHDSTVYITSIKFKGINIPMPANDKIVSSKEDPRIGQVYYDGSDYLCYYNRTWCHCDLIEENGVESLDINCSVDALVFYYATVRREYY